MVIHDLPAYFKSFAVLTPQDLKVCPESVHKSSPSKTGLIEGLD